MSLAYIPFTFPCIPQVRCAFQTRLDETITTSDDSPEQIAHTVQQFGEGLGVPKSASVIQVHEKTLLFEPNPNNVPQQADGLATSSAGIGLAIRTADCQPILLAHISGKYIAALHVGWRGNRNGFISSALALFCAQYRLRPSDILAVRGPSLGPSYSEFINYDREWGRRFDAWYSVREKTVNLWRMTRDQLLSSGITSEHIFSIDLCTASLPELFFSYRRDKAKERHINLIWIENQQ